MNLFMKYGVMCLLFALRLEVDASYIPGIHKKYVSNLDAINREQKKADKLLLAHCMQFMFPGDRVFDIQSYVPDGPAKLVGGLFEDIPLHAFHTKSNSFNVQDAKKEIELARAAGVDGFIYFYTVNEKTSGKQNEIISHLFKAIEDLNVPFYITLAVTPAHIGNNKNTVEEKVLVVENAFENLFKIVGKENPHWLRSPDGTMILFTHQASQLGTMVTSEGQLAKWHNTIDEKMQEIADGYYSILKYLNFNAYFVYRTAPFELYTANLNNLSLQQKRKSYEDYLLAVCRYFPFVKFFRYDPTHENADAMHRDMAFFQNANRGFVPSVLYDSYTTRKFDQNNKQIKHLNHLTEPGFDPEKLIAKCGYTGNTTYISKLWEIPLKYNVPFVEVITWNDYLEGHALAPSLNHCFGQNTMMNYYKYLWRTGKEPEYGTKGFSEEIVVFYKKYQHDLTPSIFNYQVKPKVNSIPLAFWEKMRAVSDSMDVCLFLEKPSLVFVDGEKFKAPKGKSVIRVKPKIGQQHIQIIRGEKIIIDFYPTEWITNKPYRTDRFTFIQSSRWKEYYREFFPEREMHFLNEYEKDADGIPNWQKRYPSLIERK